MCSLGRCDRVARYEGATQVQRRESRPLRSAGRNDRCVAHSGGAIGVSRIRKERLIYGKGKSKWCEAHGVAFNVQ